MRPPSSAATRRRAPLRGHSPRPVRPVAPPVPRRVSGPGSRPLPVTPTGEAALPRPLPPRGDGVFERLRALPDHRVVDRLLRSRAWIWLLGLALGGIVAMQVSLLQLNAGISRDVETASTLERQNADLESLSASLGRGDRVRAAAAQARLVTPPAGAVEYVTIDPKADPGRALETMRAPSPEAEQVMRNGGRPVGEVAGELTGATAGTTGAPAGTTGATGAPAGTPAAASAPAGTTGAGTAPAGTGTAPAGTPGTGTSTPVGG